MLVGLDLPSVSGGTEAGVCSPYRGNCLSERREQDGGGVGGHGVPLSPWIHQEYSFRDRSACRTPAESRQEYMTSGKEYIDLRKTQ